MNEWEQREEDAQGCNDFGWSGLSDSSCQGTIFMKGTAAMVMPKAIMARKAVNLMP